MKKHFMAIALCLVCAINFVSCGGNFGSAGLCNNNGNTFENTPEKELVQKVEYYIQRIYSSNTYLYPPRYEEEECEKYQVVISTQEHKYLVQPYCTGVTLSRLDGLRLRNNEIFQILKGIYMYDERVLEIEYEEKNSSDYSYSYVKLWVLCKPWFDESGKYCIEGTERDTKRLMQWNETHEQLVASQNAAKLKLRKLNKYKNEHYK